MKKNILLILGFLICLQVYCQIPTLAIHKDQNKTNLPIQKLSIQADVVGNISKTTFDITFYNPYDKILEGSFSFPLNEGQDVCRYALEINGKLREGVVVKKVKARQVYEAVVRQNIDPGIIAKTKGNFYKTRIYPIPKKGVKRVVFAIEHILPITDGKLHYVLPLNSSEKIEEFSLEVNVIKSEEKPNLKSKEYTSFVFDTAQEVYRLNFKRKKYRPLKELDITIPIFQNTDDFVQVEEYKGQRYFYTGFKTPKFESKPKKTPNSIAVYWDRSFSGEKRAIETELKLLKTYLEGIKGKKEVCIYAFNYKETGDKEFKIGNDASAIISYLKSLPFDGATRLDNLNFIEGYDEILFFSDGISTIENQEIRLPETPIYTFSSSSGSDYSTLKYIATKTKGKYMKLSKNTLDASLHEMNTSSVRYLSCDFDEKYFRDVVISPFLNKGDVFSVAGIALRQDIEFVVNFGDETGVVWSKKIKIKGDTVDNRIIPRVWARFKIGELDMRYEQNKDLITDLGKEHGIVTRNTSFIVLDRIEDYVTHNIVPPEELRKEYDLLMAQKTRNEKGDQILFQKQNVKYLEDLKLWYKKSIVQTKDLDKEVLEGEPIEVEVVEDVEEMEEVEEVAFQTQRYEESANANRNNESSTSENKNSLKRKPKPKIKLLAWQPNAPYLDSLRNALPKNVASVYYKLREENKTTPSFYIEVADFFFKNKNKELGVDVLSSLLELDLGNAEVLKVVARRLLDENQTELAIAVYREILELRPEEPQSHRDVALAYLQNKEYQLALDTFNHILTIKWKRFESVKQIVLNEMNALIALHKSSLDLSKVNKELIHEMPLDVRIVVDWSSNDNDIDLWVVDPKGEKCYYKNAETMIGGRISRDITNGYGPEEFLLKKAPRGFYTIYVNYYSESRQSIVGPVTVYATLYTNYGRKNQESKKITIQLESGKKTLQIGQLEF